VGRKGGKKRAISKKRKEVGGGAEPQKMWRNRREERPGTGGLKKRV